MTIISQTRLEENIRIIQNQIQKALERSGRKNETVKLLAVTKNFPREVAEIALKAGIKLFGENKVQEAQAKYSLPPFAGELHLIGHLQRNKAKKAASLFSCMQSIDKLETAQELNKEASKLNKTISILLQLNTSGESSKSGYHNETDLLNDLDKILKLNFLKFEGLMTIGPLTNDEKAIRKSFRTLKKLFDKLKEENFLKNDALLSMGMSADFEIAVEEGSNLIRIGTALFGSRLLK